MEQPSPVVVRYDKDVAWVTIDNPPVNATSTEVRTGLMQAVKEVRDARFAVLSCAGSTFVAGGDVTEFDAPPVKPHLPDVVRAIEDSPTPFLAAMHGSVLGGGFEIAMACAWRIARAGTMFGLPEVQIGLIPGAGGTQRAPRLLGVETAIDMACLGRKFPAEKLVESGAVDWVFDEDVQKAARTFLSSAPKRPTPVRLWPVTWPTPEQLAAKRKQITKRARGQQAPLVCFEAITLAREAFDVAQPRERERHLALRASTESRALRHVFFAERRAARRSSKNRQASAINQVAIVGGGLMGVGIAVASLLAGFPVTLVERDAADADAAKERVFGLLDAAVTRGKVDSDTVQILRQQFHESTDFADVRSADLVVEAVFEDLDAKKAVFQQVSNVVSEKTILATNTSYIDPGAIFEGIPAPERCIGLHFFSPAHVMKLLEVVVLPDTSEQAALTSFAFGQKLGKVSVKAGICDGFIGNRILAEYRRLAEYLVADGALPHQVDAAARALGYAMGPFEMQDMAGLQIAWANRKRQSSTRDPAQRYVTISDTLCEKGRLGRKVNKGWYNYIPGSLDPQPAPEVEAIVHDYARRQGITRRTFTQQDIQDRILAVLANEGARVVEDGVASDDADVDLVLIHGYGFPRWLGGPMHLATETGWNNITTTMTKLAQSDPGSWSLSARCREFQGGIE